MCKIFRKILLAIALAATVVLPTAGRAYADNYPLCQCGEPTENAILNNCKTASGDLAFCDNGEKGEGVFYILHIVLNVMIVLISILGVIGIAICGIVILTSKDDANRLAKGKTRLREVIIGLALFISFWGIATFLMPTFGEGDPGTGGMNTEDPVRPTQPVDPPSGGGGDDDGGGSGGGSGGGGGGYSGDDGGGGYSGGTVDGWNTLCGPNPNQSFNKSKYGERTEIYRNNYGRTFYTFQQGDPVWGSATAGKSGAGTMSGRGCYRTASAVMFNSFGLTDFTPVNLSTYNDIGWSDMVSMYPAYSNYFAYEDLYTNTRSSWKAKIINAFKAGGAVVVRTEGGYFPSSPTSMHSMPFTDYRSNNGKDEIYTFNTHTKKRGWYDLDVIVNNKVVANGLTSSVSEIIIITPKNTNLNCTQYK